MFKLGVITDEVSQDFEKGVMFAKRHGLDAVELRSAWGRDPFALEKEDITKIKEILRKYDMPICALSTPLFKCGFHEIGEIKKHQEGLKRCIAYAEELGAGMIRGFDFFADEAVTCEQIAEKLATPVQWISDAGLTLALEFDPTVNSTNARKLSKQVRTVNHPNVKALYDPGNDIFDPLHEIPYPDGYEFCQGLICHMHIKDAIRRDGKPVCVAVGTGWVDYPTLLRRLDRDGYDGYLVLETHYRLSQELMEDQLKHPGGYAFSEAGEGASEESMISLKHLIKNAIKEGE